MPSYAEAHYNLGTVGQLTGNLNEALACYEQALRCDPAFALAHFNRSLIWLLQGHWARGWDEYEWRWAPHRSASRHFDQPLWDGSDLNGRCILLYAEQGLGDTIQFMRDAPLVKERGGHVIVECQPSLLQLLDGFQGFDQLLAQGSQLPHFEVQAPLRQSSQDSCHNTRSPFPRLSPIVRLMRNLWSTGGRCWTLGWVSK